MTAEPADEASVVGLQLTLRVLQKIRQLPEGYRNREYLLVLSVCWAGIGLKTESVYMMMI